MEAEYQQFLATYRKSISNGEEYNMRLAIFQQNMEKIQEHNSKGLSYTLAMNQFGDLTQEEFSKHLGYTPIKNKKPAQPLNIKAEATVDWREKGAVNPVQNQGMCGSCWAFSATGAVEGSYFVKTGKLVKFAEQQLVDCETKDAGCNGGLMDNAFEYLETHDFCTEDSYPYTARDGTCKEDSCSEHYPAVASYTDVVHNSNDELKKALNLGPVAVAIEADKMVFQFYSGGVLDDASCGLDLDHGVLAVGYGTDNGQDYYIVKNSWGASWGEQGYIRIGMSHEQEGGICGILEDESYTTS
jgi:C1A family cysteine protease